MNSGETHSNSIQTVGVFYLLTYFAFFFIGSFYGAQDNLKLVILLPHQPLC